MFYRLVMIKIVAGGKKNVGWVREACDEYEKRLKKPFAIGWRFMDEEKLGAYLSEWPFTGREYVIVLDERGENLSSPGFSAKLQKAFTMGREVIVLIGGAYGFSGKKRT